jgi:hypothetical protein
MKKRYMEPLMEAIEMEGMGGILCSSDVNGGMEGDAGGGALAREDEWIQWALLGIALDDDD